MPIELARTSALASLVLTVSLAATSLPRRCREGPQRRSARRGARRGRALDGQARLRAAGTWLRYPDPRQIPYVNGCSTTSWRIPTGSATR